VNTPSLPTSLPDASLLPIPQAGDLQAQLAQGQNLLTTAQDAANGDPGATNTLLKAGTTLAQNNTSGLPRTLITDALGIASGFAMGGPVGGAMAIAGSAISGLVELMSGGSPPIFEGFESTPSNASKNAWSHVQNYIANIVNTTSISGYPPGWYLGYYYMRTTQERYTMPGLLETFELIIGSWATPGGSLDALAYDPTQVQVSFYNGSQTLADMMTQTPWDTPSSYAPGKTQFQALVEGETAIKEIYTNNWGLLPIMFEWAQPSGQGLAGNMSNGLGTKYSLGADSSAPYGSSPASLWQQALEDIADLPHLPRAKIAKNALKLMPLPVWWQVMLYCNGAVDSNGNFYNPMYQLDILNALATIVVMAANGAHPRAITSEILMQFHQVYLHGSTQPGEQNLSAAYREFVDEWLNIAVGKHPKVHIPIPKLTGSAAPTKTVRKTTASPLRAKTTKPKLLAPIKAPTKTVRKTTASPLRAKTTKPKLLAPINAPSPGSSPFLSPSFLYPAAGVGGALALYAGYRYLRDR
jgi:hypothetical protein